MIRNGKVLIMGTGKVPGINLLFDKCRFSKFFVLQERCSKRRRSFFIDYIIIGINLNAETTVDHYKQDRGAYSLFT